jgi:hypothetical protein
MRAAFLSSKLAEGRSGDRSLRSRALDALASANSRSDFRSGQRVARGLQFGAGVDGWRSNINGNSVVVPATTISG